MARHPVEAGFHAIRITQPATRERTYAKTASQKQIKNSHIRAAFLWWSEVTDIGVGNRKDKGDAAPLQKATQDEIEDVRGIDIPQREEAAEQLPQSDESLASVLVRQPADKRHEQHLGQGEAGKEDTNGEPSGSQSFGVDRHERDDDAHAEVAGKDGKVQGVESPPVHVVVSKLFRARMTIPE